MQKQTPVLAYPDSGLVRKHKQLFISPQTKHSSIITTQHTAAFSSERCKFLRL